MVNTDSMAVALVNARDNTPKEKVCEAVGISISALEAYESGKRVPRDSVKYRLAKYYHVSLADLFFL